MDALEFYNLFEWDFKTTDLDCFKSHNLVDDCQCTTKLCLKRNMYIYDIINGYSIKYKLCNGVVKMLYHNVKSYHPYNEVLECMLIDFYKKRYNITLNHSFDVYKFDRKSLNTRYFNIVFSERPYIFLCWNVKDLIMYILDSDYNDRTNFLIELLRKEIDKFFIENNFKKNKNLQLEIKRELKKINVYEQTFKEDLTDVLNKILTLILKNK